jgi:hypothetical protein
MKLKRRSVLRCTCCGHEQGETEEWANPKQVRALEDEILANAAADPELQIAIQEDAPAEDVVAFFEQLPEPAAEVLNCNLQHTKRGTEIVLSSELQIAIQAADPAPAVLPSPPLPAAAGWSTEAIAALPGVRSGMLPADDPWIAHNRALAAQAARAALE